MMVRQLYCMTRFRNQSKLYHSSGFEICKYKCSSETNKILSFTMITALRSHRTTKFRTHATIFRKSWGKKPTREEELNAEVVVVCSSNPTSVGPLLQIVEAKQWLALFMLDVYARTRGREVVYTVFYGCWIPTCRNKYSGMGSYTSLLFYMFVAAKVRHKCSAWQEIENDRERGGLISAQLMHALNFTHPPSQCRLGHQRRNTWKPQRWEENSLDQEPIRVRGIFYLTAYHCCAAHAETSAGRCPFYQQVWCN